MFQHRYILIFILLGFLFIPKQVYACGMKSSSIEKIRCEINISKSIKKDTCKVCGSKREGSNCHGKCKDPLCKCPSSKTSLTLFSQQDFNFLKLSLFIRTSFSPYETNISKGFLSIWLIPKIG
jgi:hypothetical protein